MILKQRVLLVVIIGLLISISIPLTSAKIGTGHLYAYIDSGYTTLAHQDDKGFYELGPGQTVYLQIANITEFNLDDDIIIKIGFEVDGTNYTYVTGPFTVKTLESGEGLGLPGVGDTNQIIQWTVGEYDAGYVEIPPCTTMTVHYKDASGTGPDYVTYIASPRCTTGHLHVIPINPAGTIGAVLLLVAGLGVFMLIDGRKTIPTPRL